MWTESGPSRFLLWAGHRRRNGRTDLAALRGAAEIVGEDRAFLESGLDRLFNAGRGLPQCLISFSSAEPIEHHLDREDHCNRVHFVLPRMLGRAAMNRLEHRVLVPDVRTGGHAHAALEDGREVRRDVAEYVRSDRDVVDFGGADEPLLEGIDVRVILLDRRVARRDLVVDLAEELAPGGHVRLVDARHTALSVRGSALALFRDLKREPDHALGALPRDDAAVHRELLDTATIKKAASRRVQAFRVLPDDDEVHFPWLPHQLESVVDLVSDVRIEFGRADICIEI